MKRIIGLIAFILLTLTSVAQDQTISGILTLQSDLYLQTGKLHTTPMGEYGKKFVFGSSGHDNGDIIWMARYNRANNHSDLRINMGDDWNGDDRFVVGNIAWDSGNTWKDWFVVTNQSRVGIGVSHPTCALDVNGTIRAKEVRIEATGWADYVFAKDYKLPPLAEVKAYIEEKKHLPNIPSEAEVKENGIDIGDMQIKLLQKIEELTLYVIELKEEIEILKAK